MFGNNSTARNIFAVVFVLLLLTACAAPTPDPNTRDGKVQIAGTQMAENPQALVTSVPSACLGSIVRISSRISNGPNDGYTYLENGGGVILEQFQVQKENGEVFWAMTMYTSNSAVRSYSMQDFGGISKWWLNVYIHPGSTNTDDLQYTTVSAVQVTDENGKPTDINIVTLVNNDPNEPLFSPAVGISSDGVTGMLVYPGFTPLSPTSIVAWSSEYYMQDMVSLGYSEPTDNQLRFGTVFTPGDTKELKSWTEGIDYNQVIMQTTYDVVGSAPVTYGDTGGPVCTKDGYVVGLNSTIHDVTVDQFTMEENPSNIQDWINLARENGRSELEKEGYRTVGE